MIDYEYVTDAERLGHIANEIDSAEVLAIDSETTSLDPREGEIRLLSINTGKGIYVIDAFKTRTLGPVVAALRSSRAVKIFQNCKFDQKFLLHHYNLELTRVFDTYRAAAILYNGKNLKHDLWSLYSRELGMASQCQDLGGSDWKNELTKEQLDYAAEDVLHLPTLRQVLRPKVVAAGLGKIAQIEFEAILPEASMELAGVPFNKEKWTRLAEENGRKAKQLERELLQELPHPGKQLTLLGFDPDFNVGSPKQLLESLQRMGLKVKDERGREQLISDTSEMTLAQFSDKIPVIQKVIDYREYSTEVKMFGLEYLNNINPKTGRIHTNYFPFTGAGRYASSKVNLQQLPRKWAFRDCFAPPITRRLVVCDYGQIELRIGAEVASDETFIGIFARDEDPHTITASLVSNVPVEQVQKIHRQAAKAVNFGFLYGMGHKKFVLYAKKEFNVTLEPNKAEYFRRKYFEAYAGVARWHREVFSDEYKQRGLVRTIAGRLRHLRPELHSEFANTGVQGTGADGLKTALRLAYDRLKPLGGRAQMIHMVHDEIMLETDNDPEVIAASKQILREAMIDGMQPFLPRVPVTADPKDGASWAEK